MNNIKFGHRLLHAILLAAAMACLSARTVAAQGGNASSLKWVEIGGSDVEGRGWSDTEMPFDRVPKRFAKALPRVWQNGISPTGEFFEFESDTTTVAVRTELAVNRYGEPNFNNSAFSGTDLYVFDEGRGEWRWAGAAGHGTRWQRNAEYELAKGLPRQNRRFRMYLPLRNRLVSLRVGVDSNAAFKLIPPRGEKPVAYYGTSIIHGAYSIRPGLALTSRLERKVKRPFLNLGFSGSACLEPEAAQMLSELDPALFVCDPYHNVSSDVIRKNFERFFDILCSARPDTPVLLVGAPPLLKGWLYPSVAREDEEKTRLFAELSQKVAARHPNFRYMPGGDFYGSDEVSMDGVHPNDEAFANMAAVLAPVISKLVEEKCSFANPVLPADFSDIDCIRSGNRFYAITSTLHLSPGMDVLESSDMVNWRVVGHVVDDTSVFGDDWTWKRMRRYGRGVWAGCIREREGKFYCYFGTPDEGIFVATAENAAGPWSAPQDDTGVLFDDDGKGYLVATHFAGGYKTYVFELTADGLDVVPESRALVNEGHGREANKLYKWNGTYYHLYSEVAGGGRRLMMARSKNVMGPYEERRVLSHPQREADEPNQGGFLVDDAGNWFFLTHHGHGQWYGRAASLLPVTWIDGWPIVGKPDKDGIGTMVWKHERPVVKKPAPPPETAKGFLSPDWAWNHAPRAEKVRRSESCLELDAFRPLKPGDFFSVGNVFSKRSWRNAANEFSVCLSTGRMSDGQRAGICHFGMTSCEFGVKAEGDAKSLYWRNGKRDIALDCEVGEKIFLRSEWGMDGVARFAWSLDGKEWKDAGESYRMTWGSYRGDRTGLFTYNESADAGTAIFTD